MGGGAFDRLGDWDVSLSRAGMPAAVPVSCARDRIIDCPAAHEHRISLSERSYIVKCKQHPLLSHHLRPEPRSAAVVQKGSTGCQQREPWHLLGSQILRSSCSLPVKAQPGHRIFSRRSQRKGPPRTHRFCETLSRRPPSGQCTRKPVQLLRRRVLRAALRLHVHIRHEYVQPCTAGAGALQPPASRRRLPEQVMQQRRALSNGRTSAGRAELALTRPCTLYRQPLPHPEMQRTHH